MELFQFFSSNIYYLFYTTSKQLKKKKLETHLKVEKRREKITSWDRMKWAWIFYEFVVLPERWLQSAAMKSSYKFTQLSVVVSNGSTYSLAICMRVKRRVKQEKKVIKMIFIALTSIAGWNCETWSWSLLWEWCSAAHCKVLNGCQRSHMLRDCAPTSLCSHSLFSYCTHKHIIKHSSNLRRRLQHSRGWHGTLLSLSHKYLFYYY